MQAEANEDDAAFEQARKSGTSGAHAEYLTSYRQSRHRREALRLKTEAKVKELKRRYPASKVFQDCRECPEMVVVPAGSFEMGSNENFDECPRHRVIIAKPFAVGKYEITFAEWDICVADGDCGGYRPNDRGWGRGRRPVINVSWYDAKAYVKWLSEKTGKQYRLLSEVEREYAARAGTTSRYNWGDDIGRNHANCDSCGSRWDNIQTAPVSSFPANPFGLHDMHGNTYEWVEDCWNDSYQGASSDGSAWRSGDCSKCNLRGGSWSSKPIILRVRYRYWNSYNSRFDVNSFRVVRTLFP